MTEEVPVPKTLLSNDSKQDNGKRPTNNHMNFSHLFLTKLCYGLLPGLQQTVFFFIFMIILYYLFYEALFLL